MKINKYYILPTFSLILLIITLIINELRFELFEIRPGYAPHNFGFNIFFSLPSTFLSLICSIIVIVRKTDTKNKKSKFYSCLIVSPIILLWIWQIIRFSIAMNY